MRLKLVGVSLRNISRDPTGLTNQQNKSHAQDNWETRLSQTLYNNPHHEVCSTIPTPQREHCFGHHILDNRNRAPTPKAAILDSQPPVSTSAGPSGLTQEQKSTENTPAPISAADVPLPASPSHEAPIDVDNGSGASKGKGTHLYLLLVLTTANFILLLMQMLRSNPQG